MGLFATQGPRLIFTLGTQGINSVYWAHPTGTEIQA